MLTALKILALASASLASGANGARAACTDTASGLSVSRVVEIDATGGPMYGSITRQVQQPGILRPKEVVLTFDDGPMPWVTKSILDTLDTYCTKATFFAVGRMALAYPGTVRDIVGRGHTLGSHTYSHPLNMPRMKVEAATSEIERGIAAVATAAGTPIAPFFRFTGLADSSRLLAYLKLRDIAAFTVDVVSNDSYIHDPVKLTERTMAEVHRRQGGIILFHDIKTTTAKALPFILASLKATGYSVVHLVAKRPAEPFASLMREFAPNVAKVHSGDKAVAQKLPFYGAIGPERSRASEGEPQTPVAGVAARVAKARNPTPVAAAKLTKTKPVESKVHATPALQSVVPDEAADAGLALKPSADDVTGPPVFVDDDTELATTSATTTGWGANVTPNSGAQRSKESR
jgi:peptidoglycan-N-acetylglucosamine deacetylase